MRHSSSIKKFGRERNQRNALMKSLARNLVLRGRMKTTEAKAKAVKPMVEKLVTKGKNPTLQNRRMLMTVLGTAAMANKLVKTAENYKERQGGYLRITKMGPRKGDAAAMALIEFV